MPVPRRRNGSTRRWRQVRAEVLRTRPVCEIRGPGCTLRANSVDHIIPISLAPHLEYVKASLRSACTHCNSSLGRKLQQARNQPRPRARALDLFKSTLIGAGFF